MRREMDWSLAELQRGDRHRRQADPPDTDARAYLVAQKDKPDAPRFRTSGFAD